MRAKIISAFQLFSFSAFLLVASATAQITVSPQAGGVGTPGGSNTQVQYNNGGSTFGGISGAITNGTTLTLTTPVLNGLSTGTGVSSGANASTLAARDSNGNLAANSLLLSYATTATSGGTTTLSASSACLQYFTGTSNQTVVLPVTSTLVLGQRFQIINNSTGTITVQSSGTNTVVVVPGGTASLVNCVLTSGTTAASWAFSYGGDIFASGKTLNISNSLTIAGTDGSTLNIGTGGTLGSNAYTSTAYAPLASPAFTGVPTAPTASNGTNTTQVATTAFVIANAGGAPGGSSTQVQYNNGGTTFGGTFGETTNGTVQTLIAPILSGIVTSSGSNILSANAIGALAIDVTKENNTKSIAVDSTFTFSGTPATDTWFSCIITNTDTSSHVATIPSSVSVAQSATITSVIIPANSGVVHLTWRYAGGSVYYLYGDPPIFGIVAKGRVTAQNAANASIATFTVGAADSSFEVSMNMNVTGSTVLSTSMDCTYTDESNTSRTMIFPTTSLSGSFVSGGLVTATGAFETPVMHIRCKAGTTITLFTATGTFTTVTYTAEGIIKRMQ